MGAFVLVELIFAFSPGSAVLALIVVLALWLILRTYRKWVSDKSEEDEEAEDDLSNDVARKFFCEVSTETLFHKD
ncbi:MAG: hypothetical protein ABSB89_09290 [Candidatus Bathyarchaeia archaeon]